MNHAATVAPRLASIGSIDDGGDGDRDGVALQEVEAKAPPVPRLDSAAFLVAARARSTIHPGTEAPARRDAGRGRIGSASASSTASESTVPSGAEPVGRGQGATLPLDKRSPSLEDMDEQGEPSGAEPTAGSVLLTDEAIASTPSILKAERPAGEPGPDYDSMLGVTSASPQYGLLGETSGRKVALDLNQTHTISLFGVQGGGKSYTLGSIVEMACMAVPGVNALPHPLAGVIFHYSSTLDYKPEFTSMVAANGVTAEVDALRTRYGVTPQALEHLVILAPAAKVQERRAEYPGIMVMPIAFAASELKASHWKFLMGAVGSQSMYIRQLALIMKKLRGELTLDALRHGVRKSGLSDSLKDLALLRLEFAEQYVDDARRLFNKLVVFDEAHKYIGSPDLVTGLVEVVREMRHKGTSIMVASQDPPSVPTALIELSTQIILHRFNSPAWLKHIQKANAALDALTPTKLASLGPGEAYVWSSKATDDAFTRGAAKISCRPRVTQHGGGTRTAVDPAGE